MAIHKFCRRKTVKKSDAIRAYLLTQPGRQATIGKIMRDVPGFWSPQTVYNALLSDFDFWENDGRPVVIGLVD